MCYRIYLSTFESSNKVILLSIQTKTYFPFETFTERIYVYICQTLSKLKTKISECYKIRLSTSGPYKLLTYLKKLLAR